MKGDNAHTYDLFISYRWVAPDEEWVQKQLYPALVNAGLRVCLDIENFVPGRDSILEMERAVQQSRHVLCVISPEYFEEGRFVEFESLSARRRDPAGRYSFLIPLILRETDVPERFRGLIPIDWTVPQHRGREWIKLLRVLNAPNPDVPAPSAGQAQSQETSFRTPPSSTAPSQTYQNFAQVIGHTSPVRPMLQAPPLPSTFVARPEVSEAIKSKLLADKGTGSNVLVVSAIHGLGGVGKSTLAAALAQDPQVKKLFPDGVLWATLGQQPELLSLLSGWIQSLGDYFYRAYSVDAARAHINSLLQDRAVLLVVDDVWNSADALTFLLGSQRCRVLITTREATVATVTNAELYNLDVMTPEQALALMEGRLGELTSDAREQALSLAEVVGYLPLALELAAAQVAGGVPWDELRQDLEAEIARLERLDLPGAQDEADEATRKRLSLLASFYLSLRRLSDEQRTAFAWLGVLPEDTTLTPAMVATLWDYGDQRAARDTLRHLRDKALLLPGPAALDGTITCRLHDLLHDVSLKLLLDPRSPQQPDGVPGLGLRLRDAHAALLQRYRARTHDNRWATLQDDGYIHTQLAWHMEKAGWVKGLHGLLREETPEGRNAWYEAREFLGQTAGFLEDVMRAWRLSQSHCGAGPAEECSANVVLEMRYALITASLNSLAKNILPELLSALVRKGVWTITQGLTYARQVPDPQQRMEALASLTPHLRGLPREDLLSEALESVPLMSDEIAGKALGKLALNLATARCPAEALEVALAINNSDYREHALYELIDVLRKNGFVQEAWLATQATVDAETRSEILKQLVPDLLKADCLAAAYEAVTSEDESSWNLSGEVLAAEAAETSLKLAESGQPGKALEIAQAVHDRPLMPVIIFKLARNGQYDMALEATLAADDEEEQTALLLGLAPYLPVGLMPESLKALLGIEDEGVRVNTDHGSKSYLADGYFAEALDAARALEGDAADWSAAILAELAINAPQPLKEQAVQEALDAVKSMGDHLTESETLATLAAHLSSEHLLREVIEYVRVAGGDLHRGALVKVANRFPAAVMPEVVEAARAIKQHDARAHALVSLLPFVAGALSEELVNQAYKAVRQIKGDEERVEALLLLIPHAPEPLLKELLLSERVIYHSRSLVEALARREPCFPKAFWQEIYKRVQSIGASGGYETLINLAPILPEPFISKSLRVALDYALAVEDVEFRRKLLATLAPELNDPLLRRALDAVRNIEDEEQQALELAWLTPHSAKRTLRRILKASSEDEERRQLATATRLARNFITLGYSREALETILIIEDDWQQFLALLAVTPHLSKSIQRRALRLLWDYVGPDNAEDLSAYLPFVPERAIREILQIAWVIDRRWQNDTALIKVMLGIVEAGHAATTLAAAPLIGDVEKRDRLLKTLAIKLISSGFPGKALDAVRDIYDEGERVVTLEILVPLLPERILPEALSTVHAIRGERYKAKGLATLASHLPEFLLLETLELARSILWPVARAEAFAGLLPFLPPSLKVEIGRETEQLIQAIAHEELRREVTLKLASAKSVNRKPANASGRVKAGRQDGARGLSEKRVLHDLLNKVLAIDNGEARIEALRAITLNLIRTGKPTTALALAWEVENVEERALILDKLIPYFGKFPSSGIYLQWHERLKAQANRTRRDLLTETYTLVTPFIHADGANIRAEIASAIRDVGRWWR